jgi:hypothetical protein
MVPARPAALTRMAVSEANGFGLAEWLLQSTGDKFSVADFQIVNGCQTSHVLHACRRKKYLEHTETTTMLRKGVWAPNSLAATIKMRKSALGRHREYSPLAGFWSEKPAACRTWIIVLAVPDRIVSVKTGILGRSIDNTTSSKRS